MIPEKWHKKMSGVCGLWLGKRMTGDSSQDMRWSLSLTNSKAFPSAFGGTANPQGTTNLLVGTWSPESNSLVVRESSVQSNQENTLLYTYSAKLVHSLASESDQSVQSFPCLTGFWQAHQNKDSGQFICRLEPPNNEIHVSGLWVGQAAPDPSLSEFYLPINPIRWSLTVIRRKIANKLSCPAVFGAGYFDDAADVENQPVLCYTLCSNELHEFSHQKREKQVLESFYITKIYEHAKETNGVRVFYTSQLSILKTGEYVIEGCWKNEWAGSFGEFSCSPLRNINDYSTHQVFCHLCQSPVNSNGIMYECIVCLDHWRCCETCISSHTHPHPLQQEIRFRNECVVGSTCSEIILNSLTLFADRPFLGFRDRSLTHGYQWRYYKEIHQRLTSFTIGFHQLRNNHQSKCDISHTQQEQYCLLIGHLSEEYIISLLSSILLGMTIVPVDATIDVKAIQHILSKINPQSCIIDSTFYHKFKTYLPNDTLIIIIPRNTQSRIECDYSFSKIIQRGEETNERDLSFCLQQSNNDDHLVAILFTSGSSGFPKGAAYTQKLIMPPFGVANVEPLVRFDFQNFHPSFIVSLLSIMRCGGRRAISTDLHDLLDSIQLARPTHLSAPPILFQLLYSEYQSQVKQHMKAFNKVNAKQMQEIRHKVAASIRAKMGNRLVSVSSGGASIPHSIVQFCNEELNLGLVDLYGSRETGPIAMNGIVYTSVELRVLSEDNHSQQGEILVHSPRLIEMYINDSEKTTSSFIELEGKRFYKTGDFGEVYYQDGCQHVRILDRLGFAIKMLQGEWLSPSRVESVLEGNPWIQQAAVFGSPQFTFSVAVIVPSERIFEFIDNPFSPENITLCEQKILQEIRFWCEHHYVKHIPQRIKLSQDSWSVDNGFLTPTLKKRRNVFLAFYKDIIHQLYYQQHHSESSKESDGVLLHKAWRECLDSVFPLWDENFPVDLSLAQLGADSLQMAKLQGLVEQTFGKLIPLQDLFEYSLKHLNRVICGECGFLPTIQRDVEWAQDCNLGTIQVTTTASKPFGRDIFITGCTGFLGPVLLADILLSFPNVMVYCLMRGNDLHNEQKRLLDHIKRIGSSKYSCLDEKIFENNVKILLGDLCEPFLGLSEEIWSELVQNVGKIYHNGARVNLVVPYSSLQASNVNSTKEIIKLAAESGASIEYISSVSVLSECFLQEEWLPSNYRKISGGYAASKIVSEILLHQAYQAGIPVHVYRISTISGHEESGYFNLLDFTGILIAVCVYLGAVVNNTTMKLQWLPVNYVSEAIIKLSQTNKSQRVFHLCGESPLFSQVIQVMKLEYNVKEISLAEWQHKIKDINPEYRHFAILKAMLALRFTDSVLPPVDCSNTKEILAQHDIIQPSISEELIRKYLKYMDSYEMFTF